MPATSPKFILLVSFVAMRWRDFPKFPSMPPGPPPADRIERAMKNQIIRIRSKNGAKDTSICIQMLVPT